MKKTITLSIPDACSEKWENFTRTQHGGFCGSCSKTVVDFITMSDDAIIGYFKNKPAHTCGRFKPDQLKNYVYQTAPSLNTGLGLLKAGFLCLFLMLLTKPTFAQVKASPATEVVPPVKALKEVTELKECTLTGLVTSADDGMALPGVNIWLKGSQTGVASDGDGRFAFPKKLKEGDILVFSFIGMQTQEYAVPACTAESIDIKLAIKMEMVCMVTLGEVAVNEIYSEPSAFQKFWIRMKSMF
jgi:hypothetical protein